MAAANKYVIGLTGNIATGKSVIRKMLEHLGAYGIDADALTHRAMAQGAPAYQPVIDEFGKFVVGKDGEIDRAKLGKLVFSDAEALSRLEAIVHPIVRQGIDHLIKNAGQSVVVVEAIKLLESPLKDRVDSIWVTTSEESIQLFRLKDKRGMIAADAQARMATQSSQADKIAQANVVIENNGDFDDTWRQVLAAWDALFPDVYSDEADDYASAQSAEGAGEEIDIRNLDVGRAKPRQAEDIANFINWASGSNLTRMDVMAAFGEKAYMLLTAQEWLVGLVGWQVENLVAIIDEIWLWQELDTEAALKLLVEKVEEASRELQAEAALVVIEPSMTGYESVWQAVGFELRTPEGLQVNAWQEAANKILKPGQALYFKQLRIDRVLRPM
ncbi:MAG: dephospho-CoA kinase [Anaerolineae bacterium]|nr:dephospho-CoA kinase [Anaerolineae bacterium]